MSVPRITQILENEIQSRLDSQDEATREGALASALQFAILHELRKIRLLIEDETGTEISDDDVEDEEENI